MLALLVAMGCRDVDEGTLGFARSDDTDCGPRDGPYRIKFDRRDGDCGQISEMVGTALEQPMFAGCVSKLPPPVANACRIEINSTCPVDAATTMQVSGVLMYERGGAKGGGLVQLTFSRNGTYYCIGTYNVSVARL